MAGVRVRWALLQLLVVVAAVPLVVVAAVPVYRFRPEQPRFLAYAFLGLAAVLVAITVGQFVLAVRQAPTAPRRGLREWMGVVATSAGVYFLLLLGVAVLLVLRAHVLEPFRIPSTSMVPTVLPGDLILVDKRNERPIGRGEVIVFQVKRTEIGFRVRSRAEGDVPETWLKRAVAIEGDIVETRGNDVLVNGTPLRHEERTCPPGTPAPGRGRCLTEAPGASGPSYVVLVGDSPQPGDWGPRTLEPGEIFVLGDNRDNSLDSRHFGPIHARSVRGRALVVWFSWWEGRPRWSRIGFEL